MLKPLSNPETIDDAYVVTLTITIVSLPIIVPGSRYYYGVCSFADDRRPSVLTDWLLTRLEDGRLTSYCMAVAVNTLDARCFGARLFERQLPWFGLSAVCHSWNMDSFKTDRSCHFQNWQALDSAHPKQSDTRSDPVSPRRNETAHAHTPLLAQIKCQMWRTDISQPASNRWSCLSSTILLLVVRVVWHLSVWDSASNRMSGVRVRIWSSCNAARGNTGLVAIGYGCFLYVVWVSVRFPSVECWVGCLDKISTVVYEWGS